MAECYSINQYEQAAHLLPIRFQRIALHLPDWQKEQAEELRLRAGHPMTVLLPRGEQSLGPEALVTQGDLELLCDTVTGYSRYTAVETMSRGYITAKGGFASGCAAPWCCKRGEASTSAIFPLPVSVSPGRYRVWRMACGPALSKRPLFSTPHHRSAGPWQDHSPA